MSNPVCKEEVTKNFYQPGTIEHGLRRRFGKAGKDFVMRISFGKKEVILPKTGEPLSVHFAKERYGIDKSLDFYSIRVHNSHDQEVGILKYNLEYRGHEAYLLYISVLADEYQGLGVGTLMITEFESIADAAQASFIEGCYLPMGRLGKFARPFYDKHGYTIQYDNAFNHSIVYKKLVLANPKHRLAIKDYRLFSNVTIDTDSAQKEITDKNADKQPKADESRQQENSCENSNENQERNV